MSFLAVPGYELERVPGIAKAPVDWEAKGDPSLWLIRVLTSGVLFLVSVFIVGRLGERLVAGHRCGHRRDLRRGDACGTACADVLRARRRGRVCDRRLRARLARPAAVDDRARRPPRGHGRALPVRDRSHRGRAARLLRVAPSAACALVPGGCRAAGVALGAYDWAAFGSPFHLSYRYVANAYTESQHHGFFGIGVPTLGGLEGRARRHARLALLLAGARRGGRRPLAPLASRHTGRGAPGSRRRRPLSAARRRLFPRLRRRHPRAAVPRAGAAVPRRSGFRARSLAGRVRRFCSGSRRPCSPPSTRSAGVFVLRTTPRGSRIATRSRARSGFGWFPTATSVRSRCSSARSRPSAWVLEPWRCAGEAARHPARLRWLPRVLPRHAWRSARPSPLRRRRPLRPLRARDDVGPLALSRLLRRVPRARAAALLRRAPASRPVHHVVQVDDGGVRRRVARPARRRDARIDRAHRRRGRRRRPSRR